MSVVVSLLVVVIAVAALITFIIRKLAQGSRGECVGESPDYVIYVLAFINFVIM